MKKKIIIDCDTGVDDAQALILALKSEELDVIGITCVAGNGPIDAVFDATAKVLDSLSVPESFKIAKGCGDALIENNHFAPYIHGKDCLGDLSPSYPPTKRVPHEKHAVMHILDLLAQSEDLEVSIVALAPLTNIALAIRMNPSLCRQKIKRIYWMGGAQKAGGNYKSWAEANAAYDPEAAEIVFKSSLPIFMYTWDMFLKVLISRDELIECGIEEEKLKMTNCEKELSGRLFLREMNQWRQPTAMIGDAAVVVCAIDESVMTTKKMNVSMELHGSVTRGMTVVDQRGFVDPPDIEMGEKNVDVVIDCDVERIKTIFKTKVYYS